MENYTKQELEILLNGLKILEDHKVNERQSIGSIREQVKNDYITLIMSSFEKTAK